MPKDRKPDGTGPDSSPAADVPAPVNDGDNGDTDPALALDEAATVKNATRDDPRYSRQTEGPGPEEEGAAEVLKVATEKGYDGTRVDPLPNSAYTMSGGQVTQAEQLTAMGKPGVKVEHEDVDEEE